MAQEKAEAVIALAREQEFAWWLAGGITLRGCALAAQGQVEEGIAQLCQGLAAGQATGAELDLPGMLAALAEMYGKVGQVEAGFKVLDEAMAIMCKNENRSHEAELYRIKGELTLQKEAGGWRLETSFPSPQASRLQPHVSRGAEREAEECFLKAIEIARKQQAKSLELRATVSLARLWQQQDKQREARIMLSEIYNWFTEGFDTKDLQEAKTLLEALV